MRKHDLTRSLLCRHTWWKGLRELVCLLRIGYREGVEVLGAADLELDNSLALLDLYGSGILSASLLQEVANVTDLLRLRRAETRGSAYEIHHQEAPPVQSELTIHSPVHTSTQQDAKRQQNY